MQTMASPTADDYLHWPVSHSCLIGIVIQALKVVNQNMALAQSRPPEILLGMRDGAWWWENEPCEADNLVRCGRCKPLPFPKVVYMTRGWSGAFHKSQGCEALQGGQAKVERRGGDPASVEPVNVQVALGSGRRPCLICLAQQ